jgi:hypothetical protein
MAHPRLLQFPHLYHIDLIRIDGLWIDLLARHQGVRSTSVHASHFRVLHGVVAVTFADLKAMENSM